MVPVVLLSLVLLVALPARLALWNASREQRQERPAGGRAVTALRERRSRKPQLPEGHRPPPGLGPLSPSERFLTTEATRGLRELQLFLLDPA